MLDVARSCVALLKAFPAVSGAKLCNTAGGPIVRWEVGQGEGAQLQAALFMLPGLVLRPQTSNTHSCMQTYKQIYR